MFASNNLNGLENSLIMSTQNYLHLITSTDFKEFITISTICMCIYNVCVYDSSKNLKRALITVVFFHSISPNSLNVKAVPLK